MDKQKDRLVDYALTRGLNQTQLELFLGLSSGTLSHATKGLSQKVLTKVFKAFPELNPLWLLTGEGQKLRETSSLTNLYSAGDNAIQVATSFGSIGQQSQSDDKKRIAELEAEVRELKSRLYDMMTKK